MIKEAIIKLSKKENLTYQEAETVMNEIMSGEATPVQMSSYLTALSMKGETIDEITASASGMRATGKFPDPPGTMPLCRSESGLCKVDNRTAFSSLPV